jgi:hypothetical protein
MVTGEDRLAQVIEPLAATVTFVTLPLRLGLIPAALGDLGGATLGTPYAVRPPHRANGSETLGVVDEGLDVEHRRGFSGPERSTVAIPPECRVYR